MDELTMVRGFRPDAPTITDTAHARIRGRVLEVVDARSTTIAPRRRVGLWRPPLMRRTVVIAAAAVALLAAGAAGALTLKVLAQERATAGFSALEDETLPPPPREVMYGPTGFLALGPGPYEDARTVGDGMYLARRGDTLCTFVVRGTGGCNDQLPDGDVKLEGTLMRQYDAATAPFQVYLFGFARDSVASIIVTTNAGLSVSLPVEHNAFQTTLKNTTFEDIAAVEAVSTSGKPTQLNISGYHGPMPNLTQAEPPTVYAAERGPLPLGDPSGTTVRAVDANGNIIATEQAP